MASKPSTTPRSADSPSGKPARLSNSVLCIALRLPTQYLALQGSRNLHPGSRWSSGCRLQRVEAPRSQSPSKGPAALDEDDVDDTSTFHDACSETAADSETAVSEAATATTQEEPKPQPTQRSPKKKQRVGKGTPLPSHVVSALLAE